MCYGCFYGFSCRLLVACDQILFLAIIPLLLSDIAQEQGSGLFESTVGNLFDFDSNLNCADDLFSIDLTDDAIS